MRKTIHQLTSNQYWGGINRRFDRRLKRLVKLGYKLTQTPFFPMLVKETPSGRLRAVSVSVVVHAAQPGYIQHLQSAFASSFKRNGEAS
jgi:hypothetical protein